MSAELDPKRLEKAIAAFVEQWPEFAKWWTCDNNGFYRKQNTLGDMPIEPFEAAINAYLGSPYRSGSAPRPDPNAVSTKES